MNKELRNTIIFLLAGTVLYFILTTLINYEILNDYYARIITVICINVIFNCNNI